MTMMQFEQTPRHRMLKLLAAIVWYVGGFMLARKGYGLLVEARALNPAIAWTWLAAVGGVALGLLKARYLFRKVCRKNLARIERLSAPRLWQFYRPGFFLFLAAMITLGAALSRWAHGSYPSLVAVSALDFSLASALLASSTIYWEREPRQR